MSELRDKLHTEIEAINFTDPNSVKLALLHLCDYLAEAIDVDPDSPPEPMLDLWSRADKLNIYDHNEVKTYLKDIVCAINAFHPESDNNKTIPAIPEQEAT